MGRNHCLGDSCATVWVERKGLLRSIRYTFSRDMPDIYTFRQQAWRLKEVLCSGYKIEYEGNRIYPYPDMGNGDANITYDVNLINYARENNPPENEMPTWKVDLYVAKGSYRGSIPHRNSRFYPDFSRRRGHHRVTYTSSEPVDGVTGTRQTLWEGEVDAIFISLYRQGEDYLYDVNILPRDGDTIEQVVVGRHYDKIAEDLYAEYPVIEEIEDQTLYCSFTLYDYDGIPGNTHVITGYTYPPTYLEITGKLESKWFAYKVEKKAWIERLEVVGFAYNFSNFGILDLSRNILEPFSPIDSSCFNVYVTNNTEDLIIPPIAPTGYVEPMFPWETELKYQICNKNKNEPLKFYVTCGCEAEICPPGTCKVDCGDHICCYDSNGIAVAEIPKEQLL